MFSKATPRKEPVLRSVEPTLRQADPVLRQDEPPVKDLLVTTTPGIEGRPIAAYLGIVAGEAILNADSVREAPSGVRGLLRRRSAETEGSLAEARETALREMRTRATSKGADAVVGVSLGHQVVGGLLVVWATGTAVRLG